jgi:hypothetical protein
MKPIWLIEDFDPDDSRIKLMDTVKKHGLQCSVIKYLPFESGNYDEIPNEYNQCVIFQGSLNLARQLRREKKWIPGVWCNLDNFKCSMYYPYFGKYLLNSDYFFIPVFELKRRKKELYTKFGLDNCLYIRPDSGFKTFTGKAVNFEEFDTDYEWMTEFSDRNSLSLVASPKKICAEYRFVICNKKVITGSTYRKTDKIEHCNIGINSHGDAREAWFYAQSRCTIDWEPDSVYVMDICKVRGDLFYEFKILELNSFSCSGLYSCDLDIIVEKVSDLAVKEMESYDS